MNDVMIAATPNCLLLGMWHANHLINSHVIGKSENQTLPKKHETRFSEWNGDISDIRTDLSYEFPVSKMESMNA